MQNVVRVRGAHRSGPPPIFRWAGSKRKLIPELLVRAPESFRTYIEPFSGSACLFFELRPKAAVVADFNPHLIQAYRTIKHHPVMVSRALQNLSLKNIDYYDLRAQDPDSLSEIDRSARFLYLNRHCFNGVYRTNKRGQFNVPLGTRAGSLPTEHHLLRCSHALRKAELLEADFETTINKAEEGDFIYLDPPYAKNGSRLRGEYGYGAFGVSDINRLSEALIAADKRNVSFLLSYIDCEEISLLRSRWHSDEISVGRQIAGFQEHRQEVKEVLITNRPRLPDAK